MKYGNANVEDMEISVAGDADDADDVVRKNIKEALEKAKKAIDKGYELKTDRDKLIKEMELPKDIRKLEEQEINNLLAIIFNNIQQ